MATSRVKTTIEQGRTYDLDFVNWENEVTGKSLFTFGNRSKKTTGLVKAVNRFIKILLTEKGSDPFNREEGTDLMSYLPHMGALSEEELGEFITRQIDSALEQVKAIQGKYSYEQDENLISAELTDVIKPSADSVKIYIRIISK